MPRDAGYKSSPIRSSSDDDWLVRLSTTEEAQFLLLRISRVETRLSISVKTHLSLNDIVDGGDIRPRDADDGTLSSTLTKHFDKSVRLESLQSGG